MATRGHEREVVAALIETKAVNFEAIGAALATYGPTMALEWDYEPTFCGTMRYYIRVLRPWVPDPVVQITETAAE